jgi:hypothetical protein
MALWGNNDNLNSSGTVALNYANKTVTGTGSSFGYAGAGHTEARVGDVIRFGQKSGTYFGDAVIVSIANTQSLTIGSTAGLDGTAISGVEYQISTLPKYSVLDQSYSENNALDESLKVVFPGAGLGTDVSVAIGASILPINVLQLDPASGQFLSLIVKVGDQFTNGSDNISIVSIGTARASSTGFSPVGFFTAFVNRLTIPGVSEGTTVTDSAGNWVSSVVSVGATGVTLDAAITTGVGTGSHLIFSNDFMVGLGSTITTGIATGISVDIKRLMGGFDKYVYGVSASDVASSEDTSFAAPHAGWVGVHTYRDNEGNLRVKTEVLVATSGITTGNAPGYPTA